MQRYSLYILTAILTFSVSSLFVLDFPNLKNTKVNIKEPTSIAPASSSETNTKPTKAEGKVTYVCLNKTINKLEKFLKTKDFIDWVNNEETTLKNYFPSDKIDCNSFYDLKRIDLNNDGKEEVFIYGNTSGFCTMRGNCKFWIFERVNENYKQILFDEWAFDYQILKQFSKGYLDIEVKSNSSNGTPSHYSTIYKFNKNSFKAIKCFSVYDKPNSTKKVPQKCSQ